MKDKLIRIAQWNANGLLRHQEELKIFLTMNVIDIILISDTHFTDKSYGNYKLYQANHSDGTAHGGAAILIKDTIQHYELPRYFENHMQASSIKITSLPYPHTSAVYCSPRHNLRQIHFETFYHIFCPKFIAGGL
jgi:exonuclease III